MGLRGLPCHLRRRTKRLPRAYARRGQWFRTGRCYRRLAAQALAAVLGILAAENIQVDVLAHSLGTRLFTQTVAALGGTDGPLNNVILLDGAEYSVDAAATFAGRQFNVVNVTNEVDAVLAAGGEQLGDPSRVPGSIVACSLGRYARVGDRSAVEAPPERRDAGADRWPAKRRSEQQSTGVRRCRHPANYSDDHGSKDQIPAGRQRRRRCRIELSAPGVQNP